MGVDRMASIVGHLFSLEYGDAGPSMFPLEHYKDDPTRFTAKVSFSSTHVLHVVPVIVRIFALPCSS
jgi:hypothetical protein